MDTFQMCLLKILAAAISPSELANAMYAELRVLGVHTEAVV